MFNFLIDNKEAILLIQSITAIFVYIIGGIWAIRRISFERPYQSLLQIEASSSHSPIEADLLLLHVEIIVKNVGHSVVIYGDTRDGKYRSSIVIKGMKSIITLPKEQILQSKEIARFINWENGELFVTLFDGPFNKLFNRWFEGSTSVTLEAGECEQYSFDCLIHSDISKVYVAVKIYETTIKDYRIGRPYYWLIQEVFPLILTSDKNTLPNVRFESTTAKPEID